MGGLGWAGSAFRGSGCSRRHLLTRQSRAVKVKTRGQSRGGNTAEEELWWMIDWIRRVVCSRVEAVVFGVLVSAFYRAESQRAFLASSGNPKMTKPGLPKLCISINMVIRCPLNPVRKFNSVRP